MGAGWAGLAASIEARLEGPAEQRIALLEAAPQLGGRARALTLDLGFGPVEVDNGQHLLIGAYRDTLSLMTRIGVQPDQVLRRRAMSLSDTSGLHLRPVKLPAPLHLALGLLLARGLSMGDRWAMLRLMRSLRAAHWSAPQGETVQLMLHRTGQPESVCQRLWHPLCVSALNTPPAQACAQTFVRVLRDSLGGARDASDFLLPVTTLGDCLPVPARSWLERHGVTVQTGCPVRRLAQSHRAWRLETSRGIVRARRVILALPALNARRLMATISLPSALPRAMPARPEACIIEPAHEAIATTYLAWSPKESPRLPPWVLLRDRTPWARSDVPGDWLFDRGIHRGHRVAAIVSSALSTDLSDRGGALSQLIASRAAALLGIPTPAFAKTITERRATFRCTPDRSKLEQAEAGIEPGLWLAGDYTDADYPATLESAVRSGLRAAHLALQDQAASIA